MTKFCADVKFTGGNLPATQEDVRIPTVADVQPEIKNLDILSVQNMINEISSHHNNPNEFKGVIRNWFERRRLESNFKKMVALNDFMLSVQIHTENVMKFKVALMAQQYELQSLMVCKKQEIDNKLEILKRSHEVEMKRIGNEELLLDHEENLRQEDLKDRQIRRKELEVTQNMKEKFMDEIDLNNPTIYQVLLADILFKEKSGGLDSGLLDSDMKAKFTEQEIEEAKARVRMMDEKNKQEEINTRLHKAKAGETAKEWKEYNKDDDKTGDNAE